MNSIRCAVCSHVVTYGYKVRHVRPAFPVVRFKSQDIHCQFVYIQPLFRPFVKYFALLYLHCGANFSNLWWVFSVLDKWPQFWAGNRIITKYMLWEWAPLILLLVLLAPMMHKYGALVESLAKENQNSRRETLPNFALSTSNPIWTTLGFVASLCSEKPPINRLL